jgi:general secretion pathway protein G
MKSGHILKAALRARPHTSHGSRPLSHTSRLLCSRQRAQGGFTLIELVMTIAILAILTLAVIPLVQVSVKRQKEQRLRETLREVRSAIDQFHREAMMSQCGPGEQSATQQQQGPPQTGQPQPQQQALDPRVKVAISDCTIFGVDNPDRYPPDLDTLVQGVNVVPITAQGGLGGRGLQGSGQKGTALDDPALSTKKKVYLRRIPVDPMTGEAEWELRSSYDSADSTSWGGENVFDIRSKSKGTALNGEKYSDW